jgi:serine/threonine protein kinase
MAEDNGFIGKQIGSFRVVAEIASGNFCRVFQAQHIFLTNRPVVAIKLMHSTHLFEKERDNFLREAQFLDKLEHPHILPIYDVGIEDNIPYLVAEYASKGSLRDRLKRQPLRPLPVEEALTILTQVGEALQYAHQQDPVVVHRDLKPENILFNAKGEALLADFGIAIVLDSVSLKHIDSSGSPPYMAPEQFEGNISKECDQYALGCIAYELLILFQERGDMLK